MRCTRRSSQEAKPCGPQNGSDQRDYPDGRVSAARSPPANAGSGRMEGAGPSGRKPNELTYVDMDTFLANF